MLELPGSEIFSEDFSSEVGFKLSKFSLNQFDDQVDIPTSLNQFLITQKDSLETIKIKQRVGVETLNIILSMPHLKHLSVSAYPPSENAVNLPNSQSIIGVVLFDFDDWSVSDYTVLLQAIPNVEMIKIYKFCNELAIAISATCKSLKRLYIRKCFYNIISNIEFFSNLEVFFM